MNIVIRNATIEDAFELSKNMRQADVDELAAIGSTPLESLMNCAKHSTHAWAAVCDDGVICMWGAAPMSIVGGVGAVWLLGSDLVNKVKKRFLIETLVYVSEMQKSYPILTNSVMVGNTVSQRWLRWAGAKFNSPIKINDVWFQPFTIGQ